MLSRNYGRGPGQFNVNLRIAKTIGLGKERGGSGDSAPQRLHGAERYAGGGKRPRAWRVDRQPFDLAPLQPKHRAVGAEPAQSHQPRTDYRQHHARPYFGFANQIAGAQNGEGFYETANNRRLESQLKFTF